jgi:hypothetical protein
MKYADGVTDARLGDRVLIWNDEEGLVVASMDTGQYSAEYPEADWGYLKTGVIVRTDKGAVVRFEDPSPPLLLVSRDSTK